MIPAEKSLGTDYRQVDNRSSSKRENGIIWIHSVCTQTQSYSASEIKKDNLNAYIRKPNKSSAEREKVLEM